MRWWIKIALGNGHSRRTVWQERIVTRMTNLTSVVYQSTIQNIINLYESYTISGERLLNLSPGFQRESVWTWSDRQKLIDSIVRNYPLPAIFLYRRQVDGEIVYDVIDGKQRLESILMFTGLIHGKRFWAKVQMPGEDDKDWVNWKSLCNQAKQHLITGYKITTIEVDGDPSDIIVLFVLINSTGKALTAAEKRHARYYKSEFLKAAGRLASRYENYFRENKIITEGQINRMKHVELLCELMVSIYQGDVINKKAALDSMMKPKSLNSAQIKVVQDKVVSALNRVQRMFPHLYQTRFHQISDFYSLVVLIAKFESEKLILTDRRKNKLAEDLLIAFSTRVDEARERQKKVLPVSSELEPYREYLLTVLQATDEISQRRKREQILRGLLESLFEKKDKDRLFSPEQRRIIWSTSEERLCDECDLPVTWYDFTVDHIKPFSKGGRTQLDNAAIMHRSCNSAKGNRGLHR